MAVLWANDVGRRVMLRGANQGIAQRERVVRKGGGICKNRMVSRYFIMAFENTRWGMQFTSFSPGVASLRG